MDKYHHQFKLPCKKGVPSARYEDRLNATVGIHLCATSVTSLYSRSFNTDYLDCYWMDFSCFPFSCNVPYPYSAFGYKYLSASTKSLVTSTLLLCW